MTRYGKCPIQVKVDIQKESVPTFTSGNTEQEYHNSKQLREREVRIA